MVDLSDLDLTLADVDLGGIDAESDLRLDEYFVTTPYVSSALQGRRTVFLGRKGSGKSALFRQLPRLASDPLARKHVLLITPDVYAWSALKEYSEQGLLPEHAHTNAWKLTLAIEIAGALLQLDGGWLPAGEQSAARLRKFLEDNYGTIKPDLVGTASSLVRGLRSFNFSAFGFGAGMTREVPAEQRLTPALTAELFRHINVLLEERRLVVGIDRLDDSWDGSESARSLLVGLLKATKDLNDSFHGDLALDGIVGLRVLVFLRVDIYDSLQFDDKDKHRSAEQAIAWTPALLREMVEMRLPEGMSVDDLLDSAKMRGGIVPFNHIVRRTFLRPREVLQFLDECISQEAPAAFRISKEAIRRAEERYSRWKVDDLTQEYQKVFPEFGQLLDCLRQEKHRYDSLDELESMIEGKRPELIKKFGRRTLLETLFNASVIGVRLSDAGSTRFKSEDSELVLPYNGAVYVHLSLFRGLNIREARKPNIEQIPTSELESQFYPVMMPASAIQDITFCRARPTPADVLMAETFTECGVRLGIDFKIDEEKQGLSIDGTGRISAERLTRNESNYVEVREEMVQILADAAVSVEDYLSAVGVVTSED